MFPSSGVVTFAVSSYFSPRVGACVFLRLIRIAFPMRYPALLVPRSSLYSQPHPGQRLRRQSGLLNSLASFCTENFASMSPRSFLLGFRAIKVNSAICRERFLSRAHNRKKDKCKTSPNFVCYLIIHADFSLQIVRVTLFCAEIINNASRDQKYSC